MEDLRTYSGISTKIRSMKSKLLTQKDYTALANLSSIPEAVDYLKQQPAYKDILSDADENSLHRGSLEQLLFNLSYKDFFKLYRFSNMKLRKFLDMHFLNYEASALKSCFRTVYDHQSVNLNLSVFQDYFDHHSDVDLKKLMAAESIPDLLEALKNSGYYPVLSKLSEQPNVSMFDYGMAIDMYAFREIWKQKEKYFKGLDRELLTRAYGQKFDLLNLLWIYRSKRYYSLSIGEIYNLILPIHYKLRPQMIKTMVEAATTEEFMGILKTCYYGKDYSAHLSSDEKYSLEELYYALLNHSYIADFRKHPYSIASLNTYLYLRHLEYSRLTTLLEGVRYGLQPTSILQYIYKYNPEVPKND